MPIHPIGELNRKGTLGSYYSVKDYFDVDPDLGTKDDFRQLVSEIHKLGMYVIIDWVANHTSWDNGWTVSNPDFYKRDSLGNFVPPVPDWSDVIALDYNNKGLWQEMNRALE
jgi:glycosidase